ncbi:hypothetical protein M3I53_36930 [Paraburkholderia sp. CNPSo 3272]|uniref:hypothetical protein n=1 Tax=Paraburkholderia sp. CNPSo 3272 TaxID=2940931 RepID=UPI0020B6BAC4|nr:hypothetical protein [Paraburkholderia sp. CNPSo 3272]MCP3728609.1 hypothetical protein [Paraburkholderia sp. CNPSo 3272]
MAHGFELVAFVLPVGCHPDSTPATRRGTGGCVLDGHEPRPSVRAGATFGTTIFAAGAIGIWFRALDPLNFLRRMCEAQQHVAQCSESGTAPTAAKTPARVPLADFLASLGTAWQDGEVRPTHHRKARVPLPGTTGKIRWEHTWPTIQQWLQSEPGITAKKLHERLVAIAPAMYSGAQLRTLQRRVKAWRSNRARELVIMTLGGADAMKAGAATQQQPSSQNNRRVTTTRE